MKVILIQILLGTCGWSLAPAFAQQQLEDSVKNLENVTQALSTQVSFDSKRLSELEREVMRKNDQIQFLKADMAAMNSSLIAERTARAALETKLNGLEQQITNLKSTVQENASPTRSNIMFSVTNPRAGHGLQFKPAFQQIITNEGNGFDKATSEFTCSKDGFYLFSATIQKDSSADMSLTCWIRRNGRPLVMLQAHDEFPGTPISASNSIIVHLTPGDNVDIGQCSGDAGFLPDGTTFTGTLL